jgi:hypothetical protein
MRPGQEHTRRITNGRVGDELHELSFVHSRRSRSNALQFRPVRTGSVIRLPRADLYGVVNLGDEAEICGWIAAGSQNVANRKPCDGETRGEGQDEPRCPSSCSTIHGSFEKSHTFVYPPSLFSRVIDPPEASKKWPGGILVPREKNHQNASLILSRSDRLKAGRTGENGTQEGRRHRHFPDDRIRPAPGSDGS